MTKKERESYAWRKMCFGGGMVLFVGLWTYFKSVRMALLIMGLLIFLTGFFMAYRKK